MVILDNYKFLLWRNKTHWKKIKTLNSITTECPISFLIAERMTETSFVVIVVFGHVACAILVPQPGIEPAPLAVEAWSLQPLDHQESPPKPLLISFLGLYCLLIGSFSRGRWQKDPIKQTASSKQCFEFTPKPIQLWVKSNACFAHHFGNPAEL